MSETRSSSLPDLPRAITSFGAASIDGAVYVYGGHHGTAHHYSEAGQSGDLLKLEVGGESWQQLAGGPKLQGLAMVAFAGKLYRAGGFISRNQEEEEQDLWSTDEFACYDPGQDSWQSLPAMPRPRSSFDAALLGEVLYLCGGWELQGNKESTWADTAFAINLADPSPGWTELPQPPFQRRALSVGGYQNRLYVMGGMQPAGEVSSETAVFDPAAGSWSTGPSLPEGDMEGFGSAACSVGGRLYVSTSSGKLLQLSEAGDAWEPVCTVKENRFFHRMVPLGERQVALIGGASMRSGKYDSVEVVDVG